MKQWHNKCWISIDQNSNSESAISLLPLSSHTCPSVWKQPNAITAAARKFVTQLVSLGITRDDVKMQFLSAPVLYSSSSSMRHTHLQFRILPRTRNQDSQWTLDHTLMILNHLLDYRTSSLQSKRDVSSWTRRKKTQGNKERSTNGRENCEPGPTGTRWFARKRDGESVS